MQVQASTAIISFPSELTGLFDDPGVFVLSFDHQAAIVGANAGWLKRTGYPDPSTDPLSLADVMLAGNGCTVDDLARRIRDGELIVGLDIAFRSRSGTLVSAEGMISPITIAGQPVIAVGVFRERRASPSRSHGARPDPVLLQAMVEFAPSAMIIADKDERIVAFNQKFLECWGLDESIVRAGKARSAALRIVKDPDAFLASLKDLYGSRNETRDGLIPLIDGRVLEWYSAATWDGLGRYVGRAWYYVDVTRRYQAERDLQRSEELYRQLAANFPDGAVFIFDDKLDFLLADGAGLGEIGLTKQEIDGRNLSDVLPPHLRDQLRPLCEVALRGIHGRDIVRTSDRVYSVATVPLEFSDAVAGRHGMAIVQDVTHQKQLEDRLRGAEARLRALVEQIPAVIYVQQVGDSGNTTIFISPQVESIFGYPPEELLDGSIDWLETIHPDDRQKVLVGTESANVSRSSFTMDYRAVTRDGQVRWVRDEATVISDDDGRSRYWQGILTDITEERRLEDALRESESLFRSAFNDAPTGIVLFGSDGKIRRVNKAFCEMIGYDEQELIELGSVGALTHPGDLERDIAHFQSMLRLEVDSFRSTKRFIHRSGETIRAQLDVSFVYNDDGAGSPEFVIAQVQDITEQHRLGEELRQSEAIFRSAFDHAAIGMARVSPTGRWLDVNASLCRMLGYTREELLATDFQRITHPDDLDVDIEYLERLLDGTISFCAFEKRYIHKSQEIVWVELSVSLVRDDAGEPLFFINQVQDMTERRQLKARLEHLAHHDNLTSVLNRNGLTRSIQRKSDSDGDDVVGVLMIDLDGFKTVNDNYGHDAGDQVLQDTARRIRSCLRGGDIVARMGGDEFVVVLQGPTTRQAAGAIANRIRAAIEEPISLRSYGEEVQIGVSIGVEVGRRSDFIGELLRLADEAMYEEKRAHKGM